MHAGHAVLAPDVTDHLIELTVGDAPQPADPDSLRLVESLTDRQRDILRLLQVMERLGAANRVEAARIAFRAGL
ncbi:hypothetical protein ACIBJF_50280 [Streptomyces sp. NPDC050743]|uniref:hypothetical protein n=1 Tax=Streptomyces sp. NPDC050743 TaxID=3365634 RepID=UPI0037B28BC4